MLPRSFLTKCSSLLSLVLRARVVLISALSRVLAMDREWHWKYRCDIDWIFRPAELYYDSRCGPASGHSQPRFEVASGE